VYTEQDMKPLQIGRLQNFATEAVMQAKTNLFKPGPDNGRRVAIVGAGPAGIACACELRVLGYSVEIFEAKALPTGLTVYGTAPYKITNEEALRGKTNTYNNSWAIPYITISPFKMPLNLPNWKNSLMPFFWD